MGLALDATKVVSVTLFKKKRVPGTSLWIGMNLAFTRAQAAEELTSCALLAVKSQEHWVKGANASLIVGTLHWALKGKGQLSAEPHLLFLLFLLGEPEKYITIPYTRHTWEVE